MPAGPMGVALGFEAQKEKVADQLDPLGARTNRRIWRRDRKWRSQAEVSIRRTVRPAAQNVEAQIAVRYEDYSDFGTATKPKVALAWKATRDLMFRASYSEGFRAPSLQELYLWDRQRRFLLFIDTPRCNSYTAAFGQRCTHPGGLLQRAGTYDLAGQFRIKAGGVRELERWGFGKSCPDRVLRRTTTPSTIPTESCNRPSHFNCSMHPVFRARSIAWRKCDGCLWRTRWANCKASDQTQTLV